MLKKLVALLVLFLVCSAAYADDPAILEHLKRLGSENYRKKQAAIEALTKASPSVVMAVYDGFRSEKVGDRSRNRVFVSTHIFWTEVVPAWPKEKIHPVLLERFRKGLADHRTIVEIAGKMKGAGRGEEPRELVMAAQTMRGPYEEWLNIVRALGDTGCESAYKDLESAYVVDVQQPRRSDLAKALAAIKPKETSSLFERLLESNDQQMRLAVVEAITLASDNLDRGLIQSLITHPDPVIQRAAFSRLSYRLGPSEVDVLLGLLSDGSKDIADWAHAGLLAIGFLEDWEEKALFAGKDRVSVWKEFWKDRKFLTKDQLEEEALVRYLERSKTVLDEKLISALWRFDGERRVYPVLEKALQSTDAGVRKSARGLLVSRARREPEAAAMLMVHCGKLPLAELEQEARRLGVLGDPKAVPILVGALEEALKKEEKSVDGIITALGNLGDRAGLDIVVGWAVEKKSEIALREIPRIDGAAAAAPRLLDALVAEKDHNVRRRIKAVLMEVADTSIAPKLAARLLSTGKCDPMRGGVRVELLQLLEKFPEPKAKTLLHEYLAGDDLWSRIYAARALAKIGDNSGEETLLEDLVKDHLAYAAHLYSSDLPKALKEIGASGLAKRLEAAYEKAGAKEREGIGGALVELQDWNSLEFFLKLLQREDRTARGQGALGVLQLMWDEDEERGYLRIQDLTEDIVSAAQLVLAGPGLREIPPTAKTIILSVEPGWQAVVYDVGKKKATLFERGNARAPFPYEKLDLKKEECLMGWVMWRQKKDLMMFNARIGECDYSHLFKKKDDAWTLLAPLGFGIR